MPFSTHWKAVYDLIRLTDSEWLTITAQSTHANAYVSAFWFFYLDGRIVGIIIGFALYGIYLAYRFIYLQLLFLGRLRMGAGARMFNCTGKEIIYVVSPAYNRTGGLELLHQLVYTLNQRNLHAYITYQDVSKKRTDSPINAAYAKYVSEYRCLDEIEDVESNIVVLPELAVNLMQRFQHARVAVWWLSVDNYLKGYTIGKAYELIGLKGVLWYLKNRKWRYRVDKINTVIRYNLAQSYYAIDFLESNGFSNIAYLSDYINQDYLDEETSEGDRENVVLYNPKKGIKYTKYLMRLAKDITWKPLQNMTNEQVRDALHKSKVYVDFGNHPGKDRFPREAAICGCCILTGMKGAAGYDKDIPIPSEYKFKDCAESGPKVIEKIRECFSHFKDNQEQFAAYRKMIMNEYAAFGADVERIFLQ